MNRLIAWGLVLLWAAASSGRAGAQTWVNTGYEQFPMLRALVRSQGIAWDSDTGGLLFSWQLGLERTDMDYRLQASRFIAIPPELGALGGNHIGDIDYAGGVLYAPIEDGSDYLHPHVALFDAQSLDYLGVAYPISTALQSEGVPWVAVDGAAGRAYMAEWNPSEAINVFDLEDFSFVESIPLVPALGRIQGAKVFDGALYASTDDAHMTVYRIDLSSGRSTPLFSLDALPGVNPLDPLLEAEGIAFYRGEDGAEMHVMLIQSIFTGEGSTGPRVLPSTCLYHFKRVD